MCSEPVDFPYFRPRSGTVKRPLLWLYIENPHDENNQGFRYPGLIDTGADRSMVPYTLFKELGHDFEAGHSPSQAGGIGKGTMRTYTHSARITVLATPKDGKAGRTEDAVFFPIDMDLVFVEQSLPFILLGQKDFQQLFHYQQIRAEWKFSLRRI